jgi:uncharacterized membrane protein (UPF0136 family)
MTPPVLAQALVAAAAPPNDYESVAGDLHEEYVRLARTAGVGAANRWYWAQALGSVPSLLSYSRAHRSVKTAAATTLVVAGVVLAMTLAIEPIQDLLHALFRAPRTPVWAVFFAGWVDAAVFGGVLALMSRSGGVRLALVASLLFVASIVIPTLLGFSSRLPLNEWLVILGAIPSMTAGAGFIQIIRRRQKD